MPPKKKSKADDTTAHGLSLLLQKPQFTAILLALSDILEILGKNVTCVSI